MILFWDEFVLPNIQTMCLLPKILKKKYNAETLLKSFVFILKICLSVSELLNSSTKKYILLRGFLNDLLCRCLFGFYSVSALSLSLFRGSK